MGITPATTDPVVATVFAAEARNFGPGVVYIAWASDLGDITISPGSALATLELEVAIHVTPIAFARRARLALDVVDAQGILADLGVAVPSRLTGLASISPTLRALPRLSQSQIDEFLRRAGTLRNK